MKITEAVVRNVAELVQLQVDDAELQALKSGMQQILDLADQMQSVNTEGVAPLANPRDAVQQLSASARADRVTETDQHDLFQSLAPETESSLYLVPRVVE